MATAKPANATAATVTTSTWAPLRVRTFRALWIAQTVSLVGTWMQTVGAQWLLIGEPNAATLVALVQAAAMIPVPLLALPSGVLADLLDRRRLLFVVQLVQFAVCVALAALTAADRMQPALLLTFTFLLGCGTVLTLPGYQAIIPDLVPRAQLPAASALGGIGVNAARAIGPAIAGLLIARTGVAAVFAFNAVSFAFFAVVLLLWRGTTPVEEEFPERFGSALLAGGRYVRHSLVVRRFLLRSGLFVVPGSALWALLPVAASALLGLGPGGYGLLLAALGIGAILGAIALPRIQAHLHDNQMLLLSGLAYALALLVAALVRMPVIVAIALVPAGVAWIAVLATMNGSLQQFLPGWVRARALGVYQIVFAGGQALGALVWGVIAGQWGVAVTFVAAAAVMVLASVSVLWWPLRETGNYDRNPASYWPEPHLELDPAPEGGPVIVMLTFDVAPENAPAFIAAMDPVRRSRRRTGAIRWRLLRDGGSPDRFVEISVYPSWGEHVRQHTRRLTGTDQAFEEEAIALARGRPTVTHLLPADTGDPLAPEPLPAEPDDL